MNLPKEIWQIIFEQLCFISKIHLRSCCWFTYSLIFDDFLNIDMKYFNKLNDAIISNYKNIKKLEALGNKITDAGIKHMQLHTLNASHNIKITDAGIKHMQLHTLNASHNMKITDAGIKHM